MCSNHFSAKHKASPGCCAKTEGNIKRDMSIIAGKTVKKSLSRRETLEGQREREKEEKKQSPTNTRHYNVTPARAAFAVLEP